MRKNPFSLLVMAMAVMVVANPAHAGPRSEALQITKAAGLKQLKDVPREKLEGAIVGRPDMTANNVSTTVLIGTEVFSQQTGWSLASETGALAALTFLEALKQYEPERHTRLLAWMPRDLADSPEAAAKQIKAVLAEAYAKALPDYRVQLSSKYFGGINDGVYGYLAIQGADCEDCGVYSRPIFHHEVKPKSRNAPKLIGGYKAYFWGISGKTNGALVGYPVGIDYLSREDRLNILTAVSRHLPEWAYIYVAPGDDFAPFPVVLHQGEPKFFVEPAE